MENYTLALRRAWSRVNSLPNVVGVGIGYKEKANERTDKLAVIIFVSKKVPERDLTTTEIVPQTIANVETDVVEIGEVRLLSLRTTRVRPAQPGVSIGHYKITAGTLGALVKDAKSGAPLILSNNHILANSSNGQDGRAKVGDPIYQPGPYDGGTSEDTIARLERFVPVITEYQESTCPVSRRLARTENFFVHLVRPDYEVRFHKRNSEGNLVDCAVARPISDRLVTPEILEVGPVRGVAEARLGETLIKSGRTSGLTRGKITALSATLRIQMHSGVYALFSDQIVADLKSQGGDSGSLVLNEQNEAVGLLFAGSDRSTILNRIQNVMDKLNITF
jgi:hypothetical protein